MRYQIVKIWRQELVKKFLETAFNFCFLVLCLIGLMYQVVDITNSFFQYPIKIGVNLYKPDLLDAQATTVCARLYDILDYDAMKADNQTVWEHQDITDDLDLKEILAISSLVDDSLSIGEILMYTPSVADVVTKIQWRQNNSYVIYEETDPKKITELLIVKKFLYLEFMCYTFVFNDSTNGTLRMHSVSGTPVKPGVIYELTLNDTLKKTLNMKLILHRGSLAPKRSLKNSGTIVKSVKNKHEDTWRKWFNRGKDDVWVRYNVFILTRVAYSYTLLPVPYETSCFDYQDWGYSSEIDCALDCLLTGFPKKVPGFLPFQATIYGTENMTQHRVSYQDLFNENLTHVMNKFDNYCWKKKCHLTACNKGISETHITSVRDSGNFTIVAHAPQLPFVSVQVTPWMSFAEFLTNLFSIIGVWTGVSVFGMDPVRLFSMAKQTYEEKIMKKKKPASKTEQKRLDSHTNRDEQVSDRNRRVVNILKERKLVELMTRINRMQGRIDNLKHFVQTKQLLQSHSHSVMRTRPSNNWPTLW